MMNRLFLILMSLVLISCQTKNRDNRNTGRSMQKDSEIADHKQEELSYNDLFKLENFISKESPQAEELTIIHEDCAVFTIPDSTQIAEMKGKTKEDEEKFYVAADDHNFYQYEALKLLDSLHVKTIFTKTRYLKFVMNDESILLDTKSTHAGLGLTILFRTGKRPEIVSVVDFEEAYNKFIRE